MWRKRRGSTLSDTVWTACYADALPAVQTHGGAMVVTTTLNQMLLLGLN